MLTPTVELGLQEQKAFQKEWPLPRLEKLTLQEYTNLDRDTSFTYWLEKKTEHTGSIWGGSSYKFGIFKRKNLESKIEDPTSKTDGTYSWYAKYGASKEEAFSKVKSLIISILIHRNNSFYNFLLKVCRIICESTTLNEDDGTYLFKDFVRDNMAMLFQSFVKNFYKKEQVGFKVSSPKIKWTAEAIGESDIGLLPDMNTDMILESATRKIILDTKYYQNTTSIYYDSKKFHSNNLYQIYSYLRNIEDDRSNSLNESAEGILLYPTVGENYDHSYFMGRHRVRLATVDLGQPWLLIAKRLLNIIIVGPENV